MKDAIQVIKARYESLMNEMSYYKQEMDIAKAKFVNGNFDDMCEANDRLKYYRDEYNSGVTTLTELKYILEEIGYKVYEDWNNEKLVLSYITL